MADVAVTYTFSANTTASGSQVSQNFTDLVTYINNRNSAISTWDNMNVTATTANPATIKSSAATTEVAIDNTATDGDPEVTFKLSGSQTHVIGVDDSDSDFLKFATTGITTNVAMQIPTTGVQIQLALGSAATPSSSFIGRATDGIYSPGAGSVGFAGAGTFIAQFINSGGVQRLHLSDGTVAIPAYTWDADQDTGAYRVSANAAALSAGGTAIATWRNDGNITLEPGADNTVSCGRSGVRWVAVWAVNGTIQTSHSSTKTNIEAFSPEEIPVPEPVKFNRPDDLHDSKQIGFIADDLPSECFAVIDDQGNRSKTDVYLSSVVGILCSSIKNIQKRLDVAGL